MKYLFIVPFFFIGLISLFAQQISPAVLNVKWNAKWIAAGGDNERGYAVYNFRKVITIAEKQETFIIHVSADNRYKLFVNGMLVSLGPARGDLFHWNFETVDIAGYLINGQNVVSATVWNYGTFKPAAQISHRTAFILQGDSDKEQTINSNNSWKVEQDSSYSPLVPDLIYSYYVAGPGDKINYNLKESGWQTIHFEERNWKQAVELSNGLPKGVFDWSEDWMLVPRSIPAMELTMQRMQVIRKANNILMPQNFLDGNHSFVVPANTKAMLLIDRGMLTNAYPVLKFTKGKNTLVSISYAEALYVDEGNKSPWKEQNKKGNRNEVEGKRFVGVMDQCIADGNPQLFTSLVWRTFRYIQLEISTAGEAINVDDFYSIFTGYPFQYKATFNADNEPLYHTILETGWRTARLCAMETYMDCPYYEQLQYIGDTRIQALISLFNSGDDRLVKNAITQLDNSRMPEGITLSRYPSANAQQIPPFSLWWIGMLHDYWMYGNDVAFVKKYLMGERQILNFFSKYQGKDGSLYNTPYWCFTDWAEGKGWTKGIAPTGHDGSAAAMDLQLLMAYRLAAELEKKLGSAALAADYSKQIQQLTKTIKQKYWDKEKNIFADTKERDFFSQHTNAMAILAEVVQGNEATNLAKKMITDTSLTQATIYFQYYVNQALNKAGLGDEYLDRLQVWKDNLINGLTTWAETSNMDVARSDCHAWGSSPNIEFFRIVLGIDAASAGFKTVVITPHLGNLKTIAGSIPHPKGTIQVAYKIVKENKMQAEIILPPSITGTFVWRNKSYLLKSGKNKLFI